MRRRCACCRHCKRWLQTMSTAENCCSFVIWLRCSMFVSYAVHCLKNYEVITSFSSCQGCAALRRGIFWGMSSIASWNLWMLFGPLNGVPPARQPTAPARSAGFRPAISYWGKISVINLFWDTDVLKCSCNIQWDGQSGAARDWEAEWQRHWDGGVSRHLSVERLAAVDRLLLWHRHEHGRGEGVLHRLSVSTPSRLPAPDPLDASHWHWQHQTLLSRSHQPTSFGNNGWSLF